MKNFLLLSTLIFSIGLFAQDGYNWGVSKEEGKAKFFFVKMNYSGERFQDCRPRIQWLINDSPDLHKDLYVMGAEVYRKAAEVEKDSLTKIVLEDSTLYMYQQQINRFGLKAEGYNFMGKVAYKYLSSRPNQWDTLASIYNTIVAVNDTNTFTENIYPFMLTNCAMKQFGKQSDVELINKYQKAISLIAFNKIKFKDNTSFVQSLGKLEGAINALFEKYVNISCDNIPKIVDFNALTVSSAKDAKKLLESKECKENYEKVLVFLKENDNNPENFLALADYYYNNSEKTKSMELYKELVSMNASKYLKGKAAYYLMNYYKDYNKELSRNYAKVCIENEYQSAKAYDVIGQLYLSSLSDCRDTEDIVKTRALYIAAYNQFKLAGNETQMSAAKKQFPSKEELFLANYKVGQSINTGCWINENVLLQTR